MRFLLALAFFSGTAFGYTSDLNVAFGPYYGGGTTLDSGSVRSSSGYSVLVDRNYQVSPNWAIGPRLELTNGFLGTRHETDGTVELGTYDHRIVAAGFRLSRPVGTSSTMAQGLYFAAVAGRSYSKLQLDVSSDTVFEQNQYSGISGTYYSGELGAWIPLHDSFGINFSLLSSLHEVDLTAAKGTYEGDELVDGQLRLTQGTKDHAESGLADRTTLRSHAIRLTISLGF